jgi:hypothetical protein
MNSEELNPEDRVLREFLTTLVYLQIPLSSFIDSDDNAVDCTTSNSVIYSNYRRADAGSASQKRAREYAAQEEKQLRKHWFYVCDDAIHNSIATRQHTLETIQSIADRLYYTCSHCYFRSYYTRYQSHTDKACGRKADYQAALLNVRFT